MLVATAVVVTADCDGKSDSSPEGAFRAFAAALQATREDSEQMQRVFALLSAADRRELERRAEASTRLGGEEREGAEMLATGRIQVAWVPKKIEVKKRADRRAELAVTGPNKQRARVVMVREDEGWRVSLGLAAD
jgi:hypothetical protein